MAVHYPYASPEDRRAALEMLVSRLEDEDDAVRFFAIIALEKMTGSRLGYEYHGPEHDRLRAVQTWRRYLAQQAASQPASTSAGQVPSSAGGNGHAPGGRP